MQIGKGGALCRRGQRQAANGSSFVRKDWHSDADNTGLVFFAIKGHALFSNDRQLIAQSRGIGDRVVRMRKITLLLKLA